MLFVGTYPPEFRRQMVELVHAGRAPAELAREFRPTKHSRSGIGWRSGNAMPGAGVGGLTTAEREELSRHLRRELFANLRLEREILSKDGGLVRLGRRTRFAEGFRFVSNHQADYPIATMCRVSWMSPAAAIMRG